MIRSIKNPSAEKILNRLILQTGFEVRGSGKGEYNLRKKGRQAADILLLFDNQAIPVGFSAEATLLSVLARILYLS
jgi:hypothetical protein